MSVVVDEYSDHRNRVLVFLPGQPLGLLIGGLSAAAAWSMVAALTAFWPDKPESDWAYTGTLAAACGTLAVAFALAAFVGMRFTVFQRLQRLSPWLIALALFLAAWETATAKLGLLPLPFFPLLQAIVEVIIDDWAAGCGRPRLGSPARCRLFARAWISAQYRRSDRLVAARRLLDPPGFAVHRSAAGDGLAAARIFRIPVELQRQYFPDRARDRVSGHSTHLVRCRRCETAPITILRGR